VDGAIRADDGDCHVRPRDENESEREKVVSTHGAAGRESGKEDDVSGKRKDPEPSAMDEKDEREDDVDGDASHRVEQSENADHDTKRGDEKKERDDRATGHSVQELIEQAFGTSGQVEGGTENIAVPKKKKKTHSPQRDAVMSRLTTPIPGPVAASPRHLVWQSLSVPQGTMTPTHRLYPFQPPQGIPCVQVYPTSVPLYGTGPMWSPPYLIPSSTTSAYTPHSRSRTTPNYMYR
jgi:hypothetical protein